MDPRMTIEVNKKIMKLIKSKHAEIFPIGYSTPDSRYYERLKRDTKKIEQFIIIFDKKDPTDEN